MDFFLAILPIGILIYVMTKKKSWPSHISLPFAAALVYRFGLLGGGRGDHTNQQQVQQQHQQQLENMQQQHQQQQQQLQQKQTAEHQKAKEAQSKPAKDEKHK